MKLLDVVNSPWAILPEKLLEIREIYATHLRGEKIDIRSIEATLGRPLANERAPYEVRDGVAMIPIEGVLAKRMNLFHQISGGASYQLIERDLEHAAASDRVDSIVLLVDSPGGAVDGVQELGQVIADIRDAGDKPIVSLVSGMGASAAYWLASSAGSVWISSETTQTGSIGVVATHLDVSEANKRRGVRVTEITAGRYKRVISQHAPLSDAGRAELQDRVDQLYTVFLDTVAENRGVSPEEAHERMADGRLFIGQRAIEAGLVDGVSTLPDLVGRLSRGDVPARGAGAAPDTRHDMRIQDMDAQTIREQYPEAVAEIEREALGRGRAEGALAERERIRGIEAAALPGHEALIDRLKWDGDTTPGDAATQIVAAEREARGTRRRQLASDAPAPLPPTGDGPTGLGADVDESEPTFETLVDAAMANGATRADAVRAVVRDHPRAHADYLERQRQAAAA